MKMLDSSIKNEEWGKDREEMMFFIACSPYFCSIEYIFAKRKKFINGKSKKKLKMA